MLSLSIVLDEVFMVATCELTACDNYVSQYD